MFLFKFIFWTLTVTTTFFSIFFILLWLGLPSSHELFGLAKICGKFGFYQSVPAGILCFGLYFKKYEAFETFGNGEFASVIIWMPQMFWFSVLASAIICSIYGFLLLRSYPWSLILM